ncbi:hypothetical protein BGZ63DRAFT_58314 [Mariannaea sp. PMI_226]|nr:hypothetical protein BGZ63DRAFT_58314 [Mariannaea sp. PMI_226]
MHLSLHLSVIVVVSHRPYCLSTAHSRPHPAGITCFPKHCEPLVMIACFPHLATNALERGCCIVPPGESHTPASGLSFSNSSHPLQTQHHCISPFFNSLFSFGASPASPQAGVQTQGFLHVCGSGVVVSISSSKPFAHFNDAFIMNTHI